MKKLTAIMLVISSMFLFGSGVNAIDDEYRRALEKQKKEIREERRKEQKRFKRELEDEQREREREAEYDKRMEDFLEQSERIRDGEWP